ncbi:hypothetical protein QJ854_gp110 [Moumouvirus goulette]|uniref:Repeat protein n=1 Tax=Moumouvirus goulette TaxID=1247379 RepID=M1PY10_9VIRU|nr:hypothetical protein QJ854_gp110 [Moumouvirus goulette]AGF85672.1 hypothetical protein glt_00869 [Moumouvirus goulette]
MKNLCFCISNYNEPMISNYLLKEDNLWKLIINNKSININYRNKLTYIKNTNTLKPRYIEIEPKYVSEFFHFIVDNKLYCDGCGTTYGNHKCKFEKSVFNFLKFILQNNKEDDVKFFIQKIIPICKKILDLLDNKTELELFYVQICKCIYKYTSVQYIKKIIKIFTTEDTFTIKFLNNINLALTGASSSRNINVIDFILKRYKKNLKKYLKREINKLELMKFNLVTTLIKISDLNNLDMFDYVLEEITIIYHNLMNPHNKNKLIHLEYNDRVKKLLFEHAILEDYDYLVEQLINDGIDYSEYLNEHKICKILENDCVKIVELLLDKKIIPENKINRYFKDSYNYIVEIVDLFVMYGADYEKYGKNTMLRAKRIGNTRVVKYMEDLLNQ